MSIIDPCDRFDSLPDEEGDFETDYKNECYWQSYRELTVVGDSQIYGREVWLAQTTEKRSGIRTVKVFDLADSEQPKLVIPIDKGVEFTVCGPHLLLRKDDEKIVAKSIDEVGIEFIRIEFDTLRWYYKVSLQFLKCHQSTFQKCFLPYPAEAVEDCKILHNRNSIHCNYVDMDVVAETQVLFAWSVVENGLRVPKAVLRDFIVV